jgi:hypothetical protein
MALKYSCPQCGSPVIIRFLKIGDKAWCKTCGSESVIPDSATETEEAPRINYIPDQQPHIQVAIEPVISPPLIPLGKLISMTFCEFNDNIKVFFLLAIIPCLLGILSNAVNLPIFFGQSKESIRLIPSLIELILVTLATIAQIPIIIAAFDLLNKQPINIKQYMKNSIPLILPYIITSFMFLIALALSSVCLVIPGIIFLVYFNFTAYCVVIERNYYFNAFSASKKLVKNRWWKVFIRIIIPTFSLLSFSMMYGFITTRFTKMNNIALDLIFFIIMSSISSVLSILNIIFEVILFKDLRGPVTNTIEVPPDTQLE